ncbi:hypothetical protein [Plastoroseomonas hellenica]|uniref:Uncharacterized protein n=1 Tax=Plastoroseomonas hellenica TaxID=2687306 RepID=A0ABS5F776_9PROT|nr:hypothetical protein [Plastoroseomonas hellenica]MBR0646574.1 hypothetical protein [Plastoroseomonas hellenica]MBR0668394.1 hypothetical protein [Plastoroseomonas hellenica]
MLRRFLLAAAFVATAAAPAMAQCDTRFTFVNQSGAQVNEFYFGPSSNPNWGSDRLGQNVLPSGRQIMFDTGRSGAHDFKIVWANGQHAELMRINICTTSQIVATRSGIEAR